MNAWTLLLVNIGIGSIIGGVTNELAIRMLFRPYQPWRIGRFRVPFTPGLIPRRRDEIAVQMGRLVEEHLLTTEGIKKALAQGETEQTLRKWLTGYAQEWLADERPLRQLLMRIAPQLFAADGCWSETVREPLKEQWTAFVTRLRREHEAKTLRELIPAAGLEKIDPLLESFSRLLVERLREYLDSADGQRTVQNMLAGLFGGGGGMFGGLVGMFLGDGKIIAKLMSYLNELLQHPELTDRLRQTLRQEADKLLETPLQKVIDWLGEKQVEEWSDLLFAKLEQQTLQVVDLPLARLAEPFREAILTGGIPRVCEWLVGTLQQNVERIFQRLAIREIVARQVESFPLERIEEMIIGISGREFRMITILGFVLGGTIGLIQGLLAIWWR